jgi:hypothetical protein
LLGAGSWKPFQERSFSHPRVFPDKLRVEL